MSYRILGEDRKCIVKRMEELTGEKPVYSRVPRCAYSLRDITIEKNGSITLGENYDDQLLEALESEGLVEGEGRPARGGLITDQPEQPAGTTLTQEYQPGISVPLRGHRVESIRNLVCAIYSKGSLISRATGGNFAVSDYLMGLLNTEESLGKVDLLGLLKSADAADFQGITFSEEWITFSGFPETSNPDELHAWTELASGINRAALTQERVRAARWEGTNEKYTFRTWLIRLGLGGKDHKRDRNILLKNLSGHSAFRTEQDREKWIDRQNERRRLQRENTSDTDE